VEREREGVERERVERERVERECGGRGEGVWRGSVERVCVKEMKTLLLLLSKDYKEIVEEC
jgi:hypothetical protein